MYGLSLTCRMQQGPDYLPNAEIDPAFPQTDRSLSTDFSW